MPRPKPKSAQTNIVRNMYFLVVLPKNGDNHRLVFFPSTRARNRVFEEWIKSGRLYTFRKKEYTKPYALASLGGNFFFNVDQQDGRLDD